MKEKLREKREGHGRLEVGAIVRLARDEWGVWQGYTNLPEFNVTYPKLIKLQLLKDTQL